MKYKISNFCDILFGHLDVSFVLLYRFFYQLCSLEVVFYFFKGVWYGIELDRPVGKNDGSVNGVKYFSCQMKHGVFAPLSRIQK